MKPTKILKLPGLAHGEDPFNWIERGGTNEQFWELVKAAANVKPNGKENPWQYIESAPNFLSRTIETIKGLAKDIVFPQAVTIIVAPRGLGKTLIVIALAVALALGEVFRDEALKPVRVLIIDRDNPEGYLHDNLIGWDAWEAHKLSVLTRKYAPDLRDKESWKVFPTTDFDVLVIDSLPTFSEGTGEKGEDIQEILATARDIAMKGPAVILLDNTTKNASPYKGRGEKADRVDILYECRDATKFIPSGTKDWWLELPPGGEENWADRSSRRHGQSIFRLAFIPSKFRLGIEPAPFCLELSLTPGAPWHLRDVTADLIKDAKNSLEKTKADRRAKLEKAAAFLKAEILKNPLFKTEAETFLQEKGDITRIEARQLLHDQDGKDWKFNRIRKGSGKQGAWKVFHLSGKNDGNGNEGDDPHKIKQTDRLGVADPMDIGRQRTANENYNKDGGFVDSESVAVACSNCKGIEFWFRDDGSKVCSVCHPDPRKKLPESKILPEEPPS